jgi:hypothetical protein
LLIRSLEEEQNRLALESAASELHRLELALTANFERGRKGRRLVAESAETGRLADRLAGIEETRSAERHAETLGPRIETSEEEVTARRQEFLLKRVERRQAETLIRKTEMQDAIEAGRHSQQTLDDWYSSRMYRDRADVDPAVTEPPPEESVALQPLSVRGEDAAKEA